MLISRESVNLADFKSKLFLTQNNFSNGSQLPHSQPVGEATLKEDTEYNALDVVLF